jgi:ubiquinone/menaquinone biosynthesis C-methylase UbiE
VEESRARLLAAFEGVSEIEEGILATRASPTSSASELWSSLASENPISAAAASTSRDPFVKYPTWIDEYILLQQETVLDAGCGYGRISIPLLERHPRMSLVGVDISLVMLREFMRLARSHGVADRAILYHGGLSQLPLRGAAFDCVLSAAVLLHLPRAEAQSVLRELHRVLRPGGRIVLASCFPNLANLEGLQSWLFERVLDNRQRNGPVRTYTRDQVRRLFGDWSELHIIEHGATLLPRQFFGVALPGGGLIRELNQRLDGRLPPWMLRGGWLLSQHDVVATK